MSADPFSEVPGSLRSLLSATEFPRPLRRVVRLDGWGPFADFEITLEPLTALVGVNGAGKSSLAASLRWLGEMMVVPMPGEVVPGRGLRSVFRKSGNPRFTLGIDLTFGDLGSLAYLVEVRGPDGGASVAKEEIGSADAALLIRSRDSAQVRRPTAGFDLVPVGASELFLRNLGPAGMPPLVQVRDAFRQVLVYSNIDVREKQPIRVPQLIEPTPMVRESGDNLVAVLHHLRGQRESWPEVESILTTCVPGFVGIDVRASSPGHAAVYWREEGVTGELSMADLSDGTVRLLVWIAICLAARPGWLLVADEPEQGLHPRVIPVLGALLKRASELAQVIVLTHSPELLAQFDMDCVRVLSRESGAPRVSRPSDSAALRELLAEAGVADLFLSGELEALP